MIRDLIILPFWYEDTTLPGLDLNREIIEPGTDPNFPDGALGIRADDDFWAVAVLPYLCKDFDFKHIVDELWPQYSDQITLCPDHGSVEQELYAYKKLLSNLRKRENYIEKENERLRAENTRLRVQRPNLVMQGDRTRHQAESEYFIQQYEQLLIAVAHTFEAQSQDANLCNVCGLYCDDRVHNERYIGLRKTFLINGPQRQKALCEFLKDDEF